MSRMICPGWYPMSQYLTTVGPANIAQDLGSHYTRVIWRKKIRVRTIHEVDLYTSIYGVSAVGRAIEWFCVRACLFVCIGCGNPFTYATFISSRRISVQTGSRAFWDRSHHEVFPWSSLPCVNTWENGSFSHSSSSVCFSSFLPKAWPPLQTLSFGRYLCPCLPTWSGSCDRDPLTDREWTPRDDRRLKLVVLFCGRVFFSLASHKCC